MKPKSIMFCAAVLAALLAVPTGSLAANARATPIGNEVSSQMQEAKRTSWELRETTDRLHAITRAGGHSWVSHSTYLDSAREKVNELGRMLIKLEDLRQHATESQQIAIQSIRPRLVMTADALTDALEMINDHRHSVYFSRYGDAVQTVSEQSSSLHEVLDAVLKYEAAKARVDSLDLAPPA